jgi:trimeric autotransporter adhesin
LSGVDGAILAVAVSGTSVYVGGLFTVGDIGASHIARWDGRRCWPLGDGVDDWVSSIAVDGGNVYVGGVLMTAGGTNANRIAKWDGNSWSPLGGGVDQRVRAVAPLRRPRAIAF